MVEQLRDGELPQAERRYGPVVESWVEEWVDGKKAVMLRHINESVTAIVIR